MLPCLSSPGLSLLKNSPVRIDSIAQGSNFPHPNLLTFLNEGMLPLKKKPMKSLTSAPLLKRAAFQAWIPVLGSLTRTVNCQLKLGPHLFWSISIEFDGFCGLNREWIAFK